MVKLSASLTLPASATVSRTGSSAIRDLLEITERPDVISLAGGLPTPASFPVRALTEATAAVLAEQPTVALQYGPTEGYRPLRSWIAATHDATVDEVVVTSGSQQALSLLAAATLDPGDTVALADPAYVGALQAFRSAGATLAPIPADEDGLRVDLLAEHLEAGLRPKLVYVVANQDNPSGSVLPADRRRLLADLAEQHDFLIVDDDPYRELRWAGETQVPLRQLTSRAVWLGSTSKVLAPGLRVGWAVGPAPLMRNLVVLKQAADLHTSSLSQQVAHRVLAAPGFLDAHLAGLRDRYRSQADLLVSLLLDRFGDRLTFRVPAGGMFLWARLAGAGVDTAALLPAAVASGVAYVPGAAFGVASTHPDRMRLSFATGTPDELAQAVERLGSAVDAGVAAV